MKLKKLIIPKFTYEDAFGKYVFSDVEVLYNSEKGELTPQTFDQFKDEFFLSDHQIYKLSTDSMRRFLNNHQGALLKNTYILSGNEVDGIINFCKVNRSEFSDLLGIDRASVTRIVKEEQSLKKDILLLILERVKDEIESPGISRILLDKIRNKKEIKEIENLNLNIFAVAEYLIRFFEKEMDNITPLKLQKLLYYAQGIGLGRYSRRLFNESFFAWEHGPVIQVIYDKYKVLGADPIKRDQQLDISEVDQNKIAVTILKETISLYGIYSAWTLRNKTHSESPWTETEPSKKIDEDKMIIFFRNTLV
jgi:uncharacterized phage-associated protein